MIGTFVAYAVGTVPNDKSCVKDGGAAAVTHYEFADRTKMSYSRTVRKFEHNRK